MRVWVTINTFTISYAAFNPSYFFLKNFGFLEINLFSKISFFNMFSLILQNFTARLNRARDVFTDSKGVRQNTIAHYYAIQGKYV